MSTALGHAERRFLCRLFMPCLIRESPIIRREP